MKNNNQFEVISIEEESIREGEEEEEDSKVEDHPEEDILRNFSEEGSSSLANHAASQKAAEEQAEVLITPELEAIRADTRVFGHSLSLFFLSVLEMAERFSYYSNRALLVPFLIAPVASGGWGWAKDDAYRLYGYYTGLVYFAPLLGGKLADSVFGEHLLVLFGGLTIALGHLAMSFLGIWYGCFFVGLLCIVLGTGLFKSNCTSMVSQLYAARSE